LDYSSLTGTNWDKIIIYEYINVVNRNGSYRTGHLFKWNEP